MDSSSDEDIVINMLSNKKKMRFWEIELKTVPWPVPHILGCDWDSSRHFVRC